MVFWRWHILKSGAAKTRCLLLVLGFQVLATHAQEADKRDRPLRLIITNGWSLNPSKSSYDDFTWSVLQPLVDYKSNYGFGIGVEKDVDRWSLGVGIKRVVYGNTLNIRVRDSLNNFIPLFIGVSRPALIGNLSVGRTFDAGKMVLSAKIGADYLLRYLQNRYDEIRFGYTGSDTLLYCAMKVNTKAGTYLLPTAELSVSYPIPFKKARTVWISYRLSASFGIKELYRTEYLLRFNNTLFSVENLNRGTYLFNALSIELPLGKRKN